MRHPVTGHFKHHDKSYGPGDCVDGLSIEDAAWLRKHGYVGEPETASIPAPTAEELAEIERTLEAAWSGPGIRPGHVVVGQVEEPGDTTDDATNSQAADMAASPGPADSTEAPTAASDTNASETPSTEGAAPAAGAGAGASKGDRKGASKK